MDDAQVPGPSARAPSRPEAGEGFTLIELMVVVLIIGILLAIAVPTFLGARNNANHSGAESNLTTALYTEHSLYASNLAYSGNTSTTGQLATTELNLHWVSYASPYTETAAGNTVYVVTEGSVNGTDGQDLLLSDISKDGICYFISDDSGVTGYASTSATGSACSFTGLTWYDNFNDAASKTHSIATPFVP